MDRERLRNALSRIESAFSRLDAAVGQSLAAPSPAELVEKNRQLRETIAHSLGEIDRLLERLDR